MSQDSPLARLRDFAAEYFPEIIAPREPTLKEKVEAKAEQVKDKAVDGLLDAERTGTHEIKNFKQAINEKLHGLVGDGAQATDEARAASHQNLKDLKKDVNAAKQHAKHAVADAKKRAEYAKQHAQEVESSADDSVSESKAKVAEQVQDVKEKINIWWSSAKNSLDTENLRQKLEERQEEEREELFLAKGAEQQDIEEFNARALRHEAGFVDVPLERRKSVPSGISLYERSQHYLDGHLERRTLGEHVQYAPLTGVYGGVFLLYFLILTVRLWYQRRKTDVYVGDGTIERYKADKESTNGTIGRKLRRTFEAPSPSQYERVSRLSDAYNTLTTAVPISLLLIGIMELNGYPRHLLHYVLGSLVFGAALATEFGVLSSDPSDLAAYGRREVGQLVMWGVMVFTGVSMVVIVWAKAFNL
ncbi:hypothetical protein INT43_005055 [Umbelopsis isabellina]|uniref:Uncharacterized protein n=1 Tax=Mortierella isabellina TaxID=91625 RepID=A0A8H7PGP6_MORIS|nr:hypothetical protein INT43_005055 [Umbelopsis isabellina]